MKSMTSYGYAEYACDQFILTMELKSYNNRYLEVSYFSPSVLSSYEKTITDIIKEHAERGHIDLSVKLKTLKGNPVLSLDESTLKAYVDVSKKIKEVLKENNVEYDDLRIGEIMRMDGVLCDLKNEGLETYQEALDVCTNQVMKMFDEAKEREGLNTKNDLEKKINSLEHSLEVVKNHADELEDNIKKGLLDKIHEMLGDQNYDENRILTEVAVMLMRYTINEEVVRLTSHIAEFKRLLESSEAVGKRMDFLCQEMNREINTIGSKSQIVEINFEVVNMKDCLENIREQIRNIE